VELNVHHVTTFEYEGWVRDSVNEVRLCPRSDALQTTFDFRLTTEPPSEPRYFLDCFGNTVHTFDIPEPHTRLVITASSSVLTRPPEVPPDLGFPDAYAPLRLEDGGELIDFLIPTNRADFSRSIVAFAREIRESGPSVLLGPLVLRASRTLHERLIYEPGTTDVGTIAGTALEAGRGVCQDYAHIMLATLRVLGVPCRYTSGYFRASGDADEVGEQASHAWVEVWFPSHGWVGVDPTNDRVVDDSYIRVAYGRDYGDVSPVRGSYRGAETSAMDVGVWVSAGWQQQQEQ
jgi:transglutaminase-like putative cysteine protease